MKKKGIIFGGIILFLVFLSLYFDEGIIYLVSLIRFSILSDIFLGVTFIGSEVIIFIFLTALFLLRKDNQRWVLPIWVSIGASAFVSFLLKASVQRLRPYQLNLISVLPALEKASHLLWNFSFPSSHTMIAFCTIPFLSKKFPRFKYLWFVFASLIAFSRIYFGLHFLSDVIVGGFIGYLIGTIILKVEEENKYVGKFLEKVLKKS